MWQVGPVGRPRMSTASPSQSSSRPRPRSVLPLVSPLRQRRAARARVEVHLAGRSVASSASASCQPTMSTRPSAASWTTAATRPSGPYRTAPGRVTRGRRAQAAPGDVSDRHARRGEGRLDRRDRVDVAMEDRGRQDGVGVALGERRHHVRGRAGAARGDDRHVDRGELTARSSARSKPRRVPSRSIDVSRTSPAPSSTARAIHSTASRPVGFPATLRPRPPTRRAVGPSARIDGDDDALTAEATGAAAEQ